MLLKQAADPSGGADAVILSYIFTKQAHLINQDDPNALEKLALNFFSLREYANALKYTEKWFTAVKDSDMRTRANMFFIKGMSLFHLKKYDQVSENLRKATSGFIQVKENEKAEEARKVLEIELPEAKENPPQGKPASQQREECLTVKKFFESNDIPDVPDRVVYILPGDWLEKWKDYNNYAECIGDEPMKKDLMEEEREKVEWLGPIDPSNLLVDKPSLVDPLPSELYTNFQLKPELEENKDFFIVSEDFWGYLHQIYGGIPVQRPTYRKSEDTMTVSVETWLQKINVLLLPVPDHDQPGILKYNDTLYISKKKTVKDLLDKFARAYSMFYNKFDFSNVEKRVWKLDPQFDLNDAWEKWKNSSFEIRGSILKEDITIEDAEISDNDTLIFEIHFLNKSWFLSDESLSTKTNKKTQEEYTSLTPFDAKSFPTGSRKGLTGLQNLGNTCFMNSAIQCLSNTFDLTKFFLTNEYARDINRDNPLGSGGKLASCYKDLMEEMWRGSSSYVSPWDLKKTIGKRASQFVGYGQQDSQELLSYLLDGLHEDLNKVRKKPFVETKDDDDRPDEVVALETWTNHLKRNQSKIQELMHGQFKSRLDCPDCKKISITFDPYMMISLPIPTVEYAKFFLYFVFENHERIPIKISFNMPNNTPYPEILTKLSKITKVSKRNIVMGLLKDHKLVEYVDSSVDANYLKEHPGILFAYEIPSVSFVPNKKLTSVTNGMNDSTNATDQTNENSVTENGNSTDNRNTSMETESEGVGSSLPESLVRLFIQAEAKAFYDTEKTVSYTRLIKLEPSDTYKDLHLKIYERMRPHVFKYLDKQGLKNPIKLEERTKAILEREYAQLFPEDNESQWIYKIHMVNTSKEDPKTGKKIPCELCQKAKCAHCMLPNEEGRVSNYLQKMKVQPKDLILELKIASKTVKTELLTLNQCTEYRNEENDETNPNRNYNIYDCLNLFTRKEKLEKDNAWYCSKCKGHKEALKKMEIYRVPPVLIIHLKRFKTSKTSSIGPFYWGQGKKITASIEFPIEGLDLSNYVLGNDRAGAIYDLYAVSNHYGGLSGGHYTAFAKNPITGQWYDFNDSRVSSANHKEIVGGAAYVLFYRRRDLDSKRGE